MADDGLERQVLVVLGEGDAYVGSKIRDALKNQGNPHLFRFVNSVEPGFGGALLQWTEYEALDFDALMSNPRSLACSYVIRKALIRKHHIPITAAHYIAKNPTSILKTAVPETISFELDYAEFLDEALMDAYELRDSLTANEGKEPSDRQWWILKAGMADRGNGIRLFSTEEELRAIFEEWEEGEDTDDEGADGVMANQLRHFVAQQYIHPPFLLDKKFHIRTYVLAVGSLRVFVFKEMLALFASTVYSPPWEANEQGLSGHLTNTCLQGEEGKDNVLPFWELSLGSETLDKIFSSIVQVTGDLFEAAAREQRVHFQLTVNHTMPNAFEIFGLDFVLDAALNVHLLEVNAYPDFKQTGDRLGGIIQRLFDDTVKVAVLPFFGVESQHPESMVLARSVESDNW